MKWKLNVYNGISNQTVLQDIELIQWACKELISGNLFNYRHLIRLPKDVFYNIKYKTIFRLRLFRKTCSPPSSHLIQVIQNFEANEFSPRIITTSTNVPPTANWHVQRNGLPIFPQDHPFTLHICDQSLEIEINESVDLMPSKMPFGS